MRLPFRILNVFTVEGRRLSGNPLCVFEDGAGLDDATMQALARQFNLSETTFLLPPTAPGASARLRIFTPSFEMPFAGHPTLGSAHVARALGHGDQLTFEMKAGLVPVVAAGDTWTLRAAKPPTLRVPDATPADLAAMVGLRQDDLAAPPRWVDTGSEQLLLPIKTAAAVRAAQPVPALLYRDGYNPARTEAMAYLWSADEEHDVVRFFFTSHGAVAEDPATGSACANLGGYLLATGRGPQRRTLRQGDQAGRPSRLELFVDEAGGIFVGGDVIELGHGAIAL
jgi:PhzF family phenazine biosynthesis protein